MTLFTKKANCGDHIDRISDLPSNVIDGILEHLNARDLVRTSVLSRKWRYMWITVPRLEFCQDFFCKYKDLEALDVSRIITEVLFLHNGPIYKFILFITSNFLGFKSGYLIRWVMFSSRKGVKNIQLVNDRYYIYRMPSHLFSCQELTHNALDLSLVHLSLIFGCSLLQELYTVQCSGYECVDLSAPTLTVFRIQCKCNHAIKSICLEKAKNLIDLTLIVYRDGISGLNNILPKIQRLTVGLDSKVS
ncbi:putative F-box domain, leucine-rich repeat domain, L domain-containing protein [Medicago truncatula]|uniref:Putative F-box domain, leucine-rich repeat domain, L domain-containing protein n=1 Tax=Medicago truncatula TaxID=3880 RepID=A0A396GQ26_MEDTR|nr:putative F-box domain, leucine-rich repeat domain, L domain-containing protein [Medicago truncatula]